MWGLVSKEESLSEISAQAMRKHSTCRIVISHKAIDPVVNKIILKIWTDYVSRHNTINILAVEVFFAWRWLDNLAALLRLPSCPPCRIIISPWTTQVTRYRGDGGWPTVRTYRWRQGCWWGTSRMIDTSIAAERNRPNVPNLRPRVCYEAKLVKIAAVRAIVSCQAMKMICNLLSITRSCFSTFM